MFKTNLFQDTDAHKIAYEKGSFSVLEYNKDLSVTRETAMDSFYASQMNVHKRQLIANLNGNGVVVQAGAMQIMMGDVNAATNIKGAGDLLKKAIGSKVTGESAIKPKYIGNGVLILEPTYKYIIMEDLSDWNGKMVIEDGLFLACDDTVNLNVVSRSTFSSAALGGEGFFNTALSGTGTVVLESPVPMEELIVVDITDDVVKIDGNMAIAWSDSLKFTVEKTTKSLVGSAASGEGFVNTYRGTGRILIAPVN
jgi:uncharacterized protein (AIM24 family)